MKNVALIMIGVFAFAAVGCASQADDAREEEPIGEQSEALRKAEPGGDPDDCLASRLACYAHCAQGGGSACYRYCDITYTKCRGLPSPEIGFAAAP